MSHIPDQSQETTVTESALPKFNVQTVTRNVVTETALPKIPRPSCNEKPKFVDCFENQGDKITRKET